MRRSTNQHGLTLMELLIALSIVAVIVVFTFVTISGTTDVAAEATARSELSKMGRNAIERVRKELAQAMISKYQTDDFVTQFKATDRDPMDEVYFVAIAHEKRYANTKEADFAEYGYWSEPDKHGGNNRSLMHREARIVDDDPERGGVVHAMAHNVREFNLRWYHEKKEEWVDEWDTENADFKNILPHAVEIRLVLEDDEGREAAFVTRTLMVKR
jgi:prepilin-type N-terminal cleavage/methylation domain-containing protein